jgi:hypothetical protein
MDAQQEGVTVCSTPLPFYVLEWWLDMTLPYLGSRDRRPNSRRAAVLYCRYCTDPRPTWRHIAAWLPVGNEKSARRIAVDGLTSLRRSAANPLLRTRLEVDLRPAPRLYAAVFADPFNCRRN